MEVIPAAEAAAHAARLVRLEELLDGLENLAVAFSGGVDSSVLLHAAVRRLGPRAVALIGDSPSLPRRELAEAEAFARSIDARLETLATGELQLDGYRQNDGQRCYFCRHTLFQAMEAWARGRGFTTLAYGEITDDLYDHRPGRRAASELHVRAPLREAGFSKADVRRYARAHGLEVADKPAAACLASRLPLGTPVTRAALARVEAAEERLRGFAFRELRVRDHGRRARVEVGRDELARATARAGELGALLAPLGFVELELAVYRGGAQLTTSPSTNSASE